MQAAKRRRLAIFRRIQAQQRFFFILLTSILVHYQSYSIERSIWMQERSDVWWGRIVNQCFNSTDWLENFRMSEGTFNHLCQELKPAIERKDSVMR